MNKIHRKALSINEMNNVIFQLKEKNIPIAQCSEEVFKQAGVTLKEYARLDVDTIGFSLITSHIEGKPVHYLCDLSEPDPDKRGVIPFPMACFRNMQQYYKTPKFDEIKGLLEKDSSGKFECSAKPILGRNPEHPDGEYEVYEFDIKSAYGAPLSLPYVPNVDPSVASLNTDVGDNEIGFMFNSDMSMVKEGYADIVFPMFENPGYDNYVKAKYDIKETTSDPVEKALAKFGLVIPVGWLQRHNPFLRSWVVNKCNDFMRERMDENTLMVNTDAIYSLKPRPDLEKEIGSNIGQFTCKKYRIRVKGLNYQKYVDDTWETAYRGTPKGWFKDKEFNILTDPLPANCNFWKYDENKGVIIANERT